MKTTEHRKFASVIFALCFVLSVLPVGAMADEGEEIPAAEAPVVEVVSEPEPAVVYEAPVVEVSEPEPQPAVVEEAPSPMEVATEAPSDGNDESLVQETTAEESSDGEIIPEPEAAAVNPIEEAPATEEVDEAAQPEEEIETELEEVSVSEAVVEPEGNEVEAAPIEVSASGEMPEVEEPAAEVDLMGDVNHDGYVDYTDARIVVNYAFYGGYCGDRSMADMNGDGYVNLADAVRITEKAAN